MKHKLLITAKILSVLIIILWLLNPSYTRFKEFTAGNDSYYTESSTRPTAKVETVRKRIKNYLIYSVYEVGLTDYKGKYYPQEHYVGIFMNFYKM